MDLILHENLCESFRYAKLIGENNDEESLHEYSNQLLKRYIEEQLVFFPNSMKVLSQLIVTAGDLFDSVIVKNEIPITDLPPACQTALDNCMDEEVVKMWESMHGNVLCAAIKEMDVCVDVYSIPSHEDIIGCTRERPLNWDPVANFVKQPNQSIESFEEQKMAVRRTVHCINKYLDYTCQCYFVKCFPFNW